MVYPFLYQIHVVIIKKLDSRVLGLNHQTLPNLKVWTPRLNLMAVTRCGVNLSFIYILHFDNYTNIS